MNGQFLVVLKRTVVTQEYVPGVDAQPEIPAVFDETTDPPTEITPAVPAVPAVAEIPEETEVQVIRSYVEDSAQTVALNLEKIRTGEITALMDFYHIQYNGPQLNANLRPVQLRAQRQPAPAREVITIEANGEDLGSAVVDA